MKIMLSKKEVKTIKETVRTTGEAISQICKLCGKDELTDIEQVVKDLFKDAKRNWFGEMVIEIPEDKVCTYISLYADFSSLAVKLAKIAIPTIELIMSSCSEDISKITQKLEELN